MKVLEFEKMEVLYAGYDCSPEVRFAFMAGAGVAGALFFGWGGLITAYLAVSYSDYKCKT